MTGPDYQRAYDADAELAAVERWRMSVRRYRPSFAGVGTFLVGMMFAVAGVMP